MDQIKIEKNKLLLVEGDDDRNFFQKLIEEIELDNIQIIPIGGKDKFRTPNLKSVMNSPGFKKEVTSLGIVRDADENLNNTFRSICTVLEECGLPVPEQPMRIIDGNPKVGNLKRIGILIIPPNKEKGQIEDLCIDSIEGRDEIECIDDYFECLKKKLPSDKFPKDLSKARIQAFLASRKKSVPNLGVAAKAGYFPLEHDTFKEIKNFLKLL